MNHESQGLAWMPFERRAARDLWLRYGISVDSNPDGPVRESLVLEAVHFVLNEGSADLPRIAQLELDAGLTGDIRTTVASTDRRDEQRLTQLCEQLLYSLVGSTGRLGGLAAANALHAGRLFAGIPPILVAEALYWYDASRRPSDPERDLTERAATACNYWLSHPNERVRQDAEIRDIAKQLQGERYVDLIDVPV